MVSNFNKNQKGNFLDNLIIDVEELYKRLPITGKNDPHPNKVRFNNSFFHRIYRNSLIPIRYRNYLWHLFRRLHLDLTWFEEFKPYWSEVLGGRPFWSPYDLYFFKNIYRLKFQNNDISDTDNPNEHLKAWQRPDVLYQLLHLVFKGSIINQVTIWNHIKKLRKRKFRSILEFGCGTSPVITTLFEFFNLPKNVEIYIADIQTIAFHYASYKFRYCSNVNPILLMPDNDFLLDTDKQFDFISCLTVFEHLNKPLETVKIFHDRLYKNGILIFDYIKGEADGLDTRQGVQERESVLKFIMDKFSIVYGDITINKSMGLTIIRKK